MMSDVDRAPEGHEPDNDCMNLIIAYLQTNKGKIMAAETRRSRAGIIALALTFTATIWSAGNLYGGHLAPADPFSDSPIAEVLCLVITVCFAASWTPGYMGFSISEFIYCLILFLIFATKYDLEFPYVHWGWTDFFRTAIGCGLFFIFSLMTLTRRHIDNSGIAAALFGLLASILFGYDSYLTFPKVRKPKARAAGNGPVEPTVPPYPTK